jgi:hypothetical protein
MKSLKTIFLMAIVLFVFISCFGANKNFKTKVNYNYTSGVELEHLNSIFYPLDWNMELSKNSLENLFKGAKVTQVNNKSLININNVSYNYYNCFFIRNYNFEKLKIFSKIQLYYSNDDVILKIAIKPIKKYSSYKEALNTYSKLRTVLSNVFDSYTKLQFEKWELNELLKGSEGVHWKRNGYEVRLYLTGESGGIDETTEWNISISILRDVLNKPATQ